VNRAKALHVSMPIMYEVNQVLGFSKSPKEAVIDLLGREQKSETH
jgi:glycerol-3-phosphate dehydrogenase (NAD(P)+)